MSSFVNEDIERIYLKRGCEEANAQARHTAASWPHSPAEAAGGGGAPSSPPSARAHPTRILTALAEGPSAFQDLSV